MVQVDLTKIIIDERRQDQVIVLKERMGERQFPIVIGLMEASTIKMKLSGIALPRPMTHDLLLATIQALEAKMERLVIDKLVENTFHAKLALRTRDGEERIIDSRPSDGIALAVRAHAPIFVEEDVLQKASFFKLD
ncbi:MAG TPA: bifunctional nuclease family protein [Candidatus Omnitrophota bacterium]|nr:bifunctional nuclease family protein [Candidatus Omnitrophota bacterium]HPB67721.1 bifunctional nuclease family protein [Candidatus Omnitrophota bacterium]HQO58426.1 bifunctional nuclease family protein [Candidatus Omnitrophota bacterium]